MSGPRLPAFIHFYRHALDVGSARYGLMAASVGTGFGDN